MSTMLRSVVALLALQASFAVRDSAEDEKHVLAEDQGNMVMDASNSSAPSATLLRMGKSLYGSGPSAQAQRNMVDGIGLALMGAGTVVGGPGLGFACLGAGSFVSNCKNGYIRCPGEDPVPVDFRRAALEFRQRAASTGIAKTFETERKAQGVSQLLQPDALPGPAQFSELDDYVKTQSDDEYLKDVRCGAQAFDDALKSSMQALEANKDAILSSSVSMGEKAVAIAKYEEAAMALQVDLMAAGMQYKNDACLKLKPQCATAGTMMNPMSKEECCWGDCPNDYKGKLAQQILYG